MDEPSGLLVKPLRTQILNRIAGETPTAVLVTGGGDTDDSVQSSSRNKRQERRARRTTRRNKAASIIQLWFRKHQAATVIQRWLRFRQFYRDPTSISTRLWDAGARRAAYHPLPNDCYRRYRPTRRDFGRQAIRHNLASVIHRLPRCSLFHLFGKPTADEDISDFPYKQPLDSDVNNVYLATASAPVEEPPPTEDGAHDIFHVSYHPRAIGLQGDHRRCSLAPTGVRKLADSGANICLTNDLQLLVNPQSISPLTIGVVIDNDPHADPQMMTCTQMGHLPSTFASARWLRPSPALLLPSSGKRYHYIPTSYHINTIPIPYLDTSWLCRWSTRCSHVLWQRYFQSFDESITWLPRWVVLL